MIPLRKFLPLVLVLVGSAILAAPKQARAEFELSWSVDNSLLASDSTNSGLLFNTGFVNGYKVSGTADGTDSGDFNPGTAGMDMSTIDVTSVGPSTLTLYLTQNGLTAPVGQGTLSETLTGSFIAGSGTVSMVAYGNDTNDLYGNATGQSGTSPLVSDSSNVATSPVGLGGTASTTFIAADPYSITEIITINFTSSGRVSLSSDGSTTFALPAPSTAVYALGALPLLGLYSLVGLRKKRNLSAAT